jgi:hypothetical protein
MRPDRTTRTRRAAPRAAVLPKVIGRPRDTRIDTQVVAAVLSALQKGGYRGGACRSAGHARVGTRRRERSARQTAADHTARRSALVRYAPPSRQNPR